MDQDVAHELRQFGFAYLNPLLPSEVASINRYFDTCDVYYDAHVPQTARNAGRMAAPRDLYHGECYCVHTSDAILAPLLWERALGVTRITAEYLNVECPTLYSANAFWTVAGSGPIRPDIQAFHRDYDDARFVAMFTLLTDTYINNGQQELEGPDGVVREIYGRAGTIFMADTSRSHRGLKPTRGQRGIHWFRWGISERPEANRWDRIEPVAAARLGHRYPESVYLRQSVRLLAA